MTREEAIDWLNCLKEIHEADISDVLGTWYKDIKNDHNEVIDMAIEALNHSEIPNSSDCIDRAEAQTAIQFAARRYTVAHEAHGEGRVVWSDNLISVTDAMNALREVPPAQPSLVKESGDLVKNLVKDDTISRKAAIDIERRATVDTNPEHFESHQKFEKFMDDAEISSFGRWQWSNGFNTALTAVGIDLKRLPSAQPENDWIPCTKKAHPDAPFRVQVQMDNGWIITAYYQDGEWLSVPDCGEPLLDKWIEAWRELPEPYQEGEQDEH